MKELDLARIRQLLAEHNTVTLATAGHGRSWAATVFYASDGQLNLYFVSDPKTRHGRDLARDPHVVGAVNPDAATWSEVVGLQIEGEARVVTGSDRADALEAYLAKFADVRRLFDQPRDESERMIAARLRTTTFWRLTPAWIRLIDSTRGFGWKREFPLL